MKKAKSLHLHMDCNCLIKVRICSCVGGSCENGLATVMRTPYMDDPEGSVHSIPDRVRIPHDEKVDSTSGPGTDWELGNLSQSLFNMCQITCFLSRAAYALHGLIATNSGSLKDVSNLLTRRGLLFSTNESKKDEMLIQNPGCGPFTQGHQLLDLRHEQRSSDCLRDSFQFPRLSSDSVQNSTLPCLAIWMLCCNLRPRLPTPATEHSKL
ncbi:hypothetical protein B0O99DRAFT_175073 [Bisporella sp. PMI_857]|nr:hypothetical protein B0O99DRAFT_175073 [Bisporella sp. PMI_857]